MTGEADCFVAVLLLRQEVGWFVGTVDSCGEGLFCPTWDCFVAARRQGIILMPS